MISVVSISIHPQAADDGERLVRALERLTSEDTQLRVLSPRASSDVEIGCVSEPHLEVTVDRIAREFGVNARVSRPRVLYREAITHAADGQKKHAKQVSGHGEYAHVKVRIFPQPPGSGRMTRRIAVLLIAMCASMACVLAAAGQEPKPRVDRTTPILQKMTPAQRHHAKIYSGRGMNRGRLLDELGSIEVFSDPGGGVVYAPAAEVFRSATCSSQAVIAGVVSNATSYPSEDGAMLFTEYEVVVSHVFKSPESPQIFNGGKLTVIRIGGVIPIEGTTVEANVHSTPRLRTNDSYLFFLKLLPEPRTFQADTADAAWIVQSGRVKTLKLSAPDVDLFGRGVDYSVVSGWVESASCR